jgi:hypothetical protein
MYIVEHGNEEAEEEIREGFKNVPCSLWYTLLMLSGMWALLLLIQKKKRCFHCGWVSVDWSRSTPRLHW